MYSERPSVTKWKILRFLISKVPLVLFAGVKPHRITESEASVTIRRNRINRNPYNATYFAAVEAAGEMAAGLMLFDSMRESNAWTKPQLVAAIMETNAKFRKGVGPEGALVVCRDGYAIRDMIHKLRTGPKGVGDITTTSYALDPTNENAKPLATIIIRWRIIRHRGTGNV